MKYTPLEKRLREKRQQELIATREQLKAARAALTYLRELLPEFGGMDGRVWSAIDAGLAHSGGDG